MIEEKEDHARTDNLLKEIQKELNDANKKISRLRNEIEVDFVQNTILLAGFIVVVVNVCYRAQRQLFRFSGLYQWLVSSKKTFVFMFFSVGIY